MEEIISYSFVVILGLLFGSFLNVVILRIPKGESIVFDASHCVHCKTKLKPWHNVPLFSYLFLRGRCSFCSEKISLQYPVVEFFSSLLFTLTFLKLGISLVTLGIAISFLTLFALSIIDWRYKMVPDSLNLFSLTLFVLSAYSPLMMLEHGKNALLFAGGFVLIRFYLSYYLFVKIKTAFLKTKPATWLQNYNPIPLNVEALGEADIMIAAGMGALLGVELGLVAIFLSAVLALPVMLLRRGVSDEEKQVPYIPFLFAATLIVFFFDTEVSQIITNIYN